MNTLTAEEVKEKSRLTKEEWREYTKTVWQIANTTHSVHPAVFPPEIPRRLIKMFTFYGETVLDPFAGVGTTASVALDLGRKAVCVEQNKEYAKIIKDECRSLFNGSEMDRDLKVIEGDSRTLDFLGDDSVDLVVTSPPYWNKASYGQKDSNLGNIDRYQEFLLQTSRVFAECYRVVRPGRKVCIVTANVNQHTDHGLVTVPIAADLTVALRNLGFILINEIIWSKDGTGGRWGSWGAQRPIFGSYPFPPNFLFKNVHEYVIIVAKPSGRPVKGPKVVSYEGVVALNGKNGHHVGEPTSSRNGKLRGDRH